MKTGLLSIAVALVVFVTPASAQQTYGPGAATCAQFGQYYGSRPDVAEVVFYAWAQGWLSAQSLSCKIDRTQRPQLKCEDLTIPNFGADEQKAFLRSFCAANPLKEYLAAVSAMQDALRIRQGLPTYEEEALKAIRGPTR